jgi:predicted GH43/DUF377 family glycosyl hydrolase
MKPLCGGLLVSVWILAGCGRYGDFRLIELSPAQPGTAYTWEPRDQPVLAHGIPGDWDAHDALNPSIVQRGGVYFNFYSGYDGRVWRTGLATSADGLHWKKEGVVLAPDTRAGEGDYIAANGSALFHEGEFWYWYQAGPKPTPRLGLARSADGRHWRKEHFPVLDFGPRGSWDERGLADPYVVEMQQYFYLFYLGQDRAGRQRLGVARSRDGEHWQKLRSNPILELGKYGAFDEMGLGEPAVWVGQGYYWMLYTGRDAHENSAAGHRAVQRWRSLAEAAGGFRGHPAVGRQSVVRPDHSVAGWPSGGVVWRRRQRLAGREPEWADRRGDSAPHEVTALLRDHPGLARTIAKQRRRVGGRG